MLISSFLPWAMSFHGLLSDKRVHSCSPTAAQADVTAAAVVQCHHLPFSHSPSPSPTLPQMFSAPLQNPSQNHFKKTTFGEENYPLLFLFSFFFLKGCSFSWGVVVLRSVTGHHRGTLELLQERSRAVWLRARRQRWLWWPAAMPQPFPPGQGFLVR